MIYEEHKKAVAEAATAMFQAMEYAKNPNTNVAIDVTIERQESLEGYVLYVPGVVHTSVHRAMLGREVSSETFAKVTREVLDAANVLCAALNAAADDGFAFHIREGIEGGDVVAFVLPGISTVCRY